MNKFWKRGLSLLLVICTLMGMLCMPASASATEIPVAAKSDKRIDADTDLWEVTLSAPGVDGSAKYNELILMLDASTSIQGSSGKLTQATKDIILTVGESILPENPEENSVNYLTIMGFGFSPKVAAAKVGSMSQLRTIVSGLTQQDLLYGVSATNCEGAFNGISEYISASPNLNNAHVIFMCDSNTNMDEELICWENWALPENQYWHYKSWSNESIVKNALLTEFELVMYMGYAPAPATTTVFGFTQVNLIEKYLTKAYVAAALDSALAEQTALQTEIDTLQAEIDALPGEISALQAQIAVLETETADLTAALAAMTEEDPAYAETKTALDTKTAELNTAKADLESKTALQTTKAAALEEKLAAKAPVDTEVSDLTAVAARFNESEQYVYGDTTEAQLQLITDILGAKYAEVSGRFWTDVSAPVSETDASPLYMRWAHQAWADVYASDGMVYGEGNGYNVSRLERAFVDYDKANNTRLNDLLLYAVHGYSRYYVDHYYKATKGQRAADAADALAAMEQVEHLYMIGYTSGAANSWMNPGATSVSQRVTGANISYYGASSINQVAGILPTVMGEIVTTPYNDVFITDYMSKWVNLVPNTVRIYDDRTGTLLYDETAENPGWQVEAALRPTALEVPVTVTEVPASEYAAGGADVEGNSNGTIYKLVWKVKDGPLLASDLFRLTYEVTVDTREKGFVYSRNYPANGNTYADYTDEDGNPGSYDIEVPDVYAETDVVVIVTPTPTPEATPTPTPEVTPTPETTPDIPDEDVPMDPGPSEDPEDPEPSPEVPPTPTPSAPVDIPDVDVPETDVPKTGDSSALWILLAVLAVAGIAVICVMDRRSRKNRR